MNLLCAVYANLANKPLTRQPPSKHKSSPFAASIHPSIPWFPKRAGGIELGAWLVGGLVSDTCLIKKEYQEEEELIRQVKVNKATSHVSKVGLDQFS